MNIDPTVGEPSSWHGQWALRALAAWLSGCAALGAVGAASTALDKVMDVSGLRGSVRVKAVSRSRWR